MGLSPRVLRPALFIPAALWALSSVGLKAWDYPGHRMVNEAALATLPADFPGFVREPKTAERIAFLAGEPDRWRNLSDLPLRHANGIDHYLDLEQVTEAGLEVATLSPLRYDFALAFAAGRAQHPRNFPPIDPAKDIDRTREWPGFAPWAVTEYYDKLKSAFSYLKAFEENGTPEEIANAQENVAYLMGVMGHYVGDLAQPLHTTIHHNGWVGPNPHGYTRWAGFHQWIDGGLIAKAGIEPAEVTATIHPARAIPLPQRADRRDPIFVAVVDYLVRQNAQVEPLYRLEKAGKLNPQATEWPEGRAFVVKQLGAGADMLGAMWLTAWRSAPVDTFLRNQLLKRQGAGAAR